MRLKSAANFSLVFYLYKFFREPPPYLKIRHIRLQNRQFQSVFTREKPMDRESFKNKPPSPAMNDINFCENGVKKLPNKLDIHKAPGPDQISSRILQEMSDVIAPNLTMIYHDPSNYRPISLTRIACKAIEYIVTSCVMRHSQNNNILYKLQHGFRSKRSCETQLLEFISDISNNMQKKKQTDVVIIDVFQGVRQSWT